MNPHLLQALLYLVWVLFMIALWICAANHKDTRFSASRLARCAVRRKKQRERIVEHLTRAQNNLETFRRLSLVHGASLYGHTVRHLDQSIFDAESAFKREDYDTALKLAGRVRDTSDHYLIDLATQNGTG